jgi:hypothetical protein
MSEAFFTFLGAVTLILTLILISDLITGTGFKNGYQKAMQEAFEQGKAVQCLGKEEYYWECKDD